MECVGLNILVHGIGIGVWLFKYWYLFHHTILRVARNQRNDMSVKKTRFLKGAPTDAADGGGMYPPPGFTSSMAANPSAQAQQQSHYQQPLSQSYYVSSSQAPGHAQNASPTKVSQGNHSPQNQQISPNHHHQQQGQGQMMSHMVDSNQYSNMGQHPGYINTVSI